MSEAKPIRVPGNPRRRKFPKFKEKVVTGQTRWVFENADFTGLMNEFRFQEKPPGHAPERSKSQRGRNVNHQRVDMKEFFGFLID